MVAGEMGIGLGLGNGVLGVGWEMGFVISWWFSEI